MNPIAETTNTAIILKNTKRTKTIKISPDADSVESKTITLTIDFDGVSIDQILTAAVSHDVIKWQGVNRKVFSTIPDKTTIERRFGTSIRIVELTPEQIKQAYLNRLIAMTPEEREMELADLEASTKADTSDISDQIDAVEPDSRLETKLRNETV